MRQTTGGRRPRGRPNRKQHPTSRNQTFDSSGPEVRVRGNAHQVYEKYLALARDATAAGDRIAAEGYYQFAEHYFRILSDSTDPDRQRPDGQGGPGMRRDGRFQPVDGRPPRGGEAPADRPAHHTEGSAAEGNGVDRSEAQPQAAAEAPEEGAEPEKQAKPAGGGRRRPQRRTKRENANGEDNGGEDAAGDDAAEKGDAEPATP